MPIAALDPRFGPFVVCSPIVRSRASPDPVIGHHGPPPPPNQRTATHCSTCHLTASIELSSEIPSTTRAITKGRSEGTDHVAHADGQIGPWFEDAAVRARQTVAPSEKPAVECALNVGRARCIGDTENPEILSGYAAEAGARSASPSRAAESGFAVATDALSRGRLLRFSAANDRSRHFASRVHVQL